jgi:hypothetical protein
MFGHIKLACSPSVHVKIKALGNFVEQSKFNSLNSFGCLLSRAGADTILVSLAR